MLRQGANSRSAPFSFFMDEKYVPIKETLQEIQTALDEETTSGNLVLLHGESGQGKSALVKYLALTSEGGIFFFDCGITADSFLQMIKLSEYLGFGSQESFSMHSDTSPDPNKEVLDIRKQRALKFDTLYRKVKAELQRRESRSMLMIFDNIWRPDIVNNLMIPLKHVKYVVTSQKSYLCWQVTARIRMAKPSMAEAHQILRKCSGSWAEATSFDSPVQREIDQLVQQVDFNPLVLANLGATIKDKALTDSDSDLDVKQLRSLRRDLYDLLITMDQHTFQMLVFGEGTKQTIRASTTMAIDVLSKEAQTLVEFMVICKDLTVNEVVLECWFHHIYGRSTESTSVNVQYSLARAQLKAQAILIAESEDVQWRQEPWTRWSIHELRRRVICGDRGIELDKLIRRLIHSQSQEEDENLVVALWFLYGDATCRKRVQLEYRLQIWKPFRFVARSEDRGHWREQAFEFVKPFVVLLQPRADAGWQQTLHTSARQIILYFLKRGLLHDEIISQLLRCPETALLICSVLRSIPGYYYFEPFPLPKTKQALGEVLGRYVHVDENSTTCEELRTYLQAFVQIERNCATIPKALDIVPHLPTTLFSLLKQSQNASISSEILMVLGSLSSTRDHRIMTTSVSGLLETLVGFLDQDAYPNLFEASSETLLKLACRDADMQAKVTAIPNALLKLKTLLHVTANALSILHEFAKRPLIARKILSTPGVLKTLVFLVQKPWSGFLDLRETLED